VEASEVQSKLKAVRDSVSEVVVGMDDVMEMLLIALLSDGHVLLEGKPGVGKTTMAKTFAKAIGGSFQRIQMTPDLLPSDVLGVNVYNQQKRDWTLRRGPIFGNIILIDELNRSSPKVQSAFLEVMQERQVTIEGQTLLLEKPFMVIATQVPYGEAGTYPLTSVQIDRFAYKVTLGYPEAGEEMEILKRTDLIESIDIEPTIELDDVLSMEDQVKMVYVHERVKAYIVDIVNTLRGNRYVRAGPGPRASINLMKGCRVRAMMEGRSYVIPDDVKKLANPTLTHRLELTVQARADETSPERLIQEALGSVEVPKDLKP
jgi:MoxR-like ATPase